MLLGFPIDYWEIEYLDNTVCSFRKTISWKRNTAHLAHSIDIILVP